MTEDPFIKRIAALSLIQVALWATVVGPRGIGSSIIGLIISGVLAYFLLAGHGWDRWWTAIRRFVGGLMLFSAFSSLGEVGVSAFSTVCLWLLFTTVVTSLIGA
jgi:hypothetical protein